jgi:Spy/CpxP family protein refolding chaperone
MTRFTVFLALGAILASLVVSSAQNASPYVGQQGRSIKALSETEIRELMEGRGMGLAKAAELNSYPGPIHVLQLAGQLDLSDAQRTATEALATAMRDKAQPLGVKIIEAERALDRAFAQGRIEPDELRLRLNAIAALQGELRAVHLETHIAQRALLTPAQIARYDTLRGYDAASTSIRHRLHDH